MHQATDERTTSSTATLRRDRRGTGPASRETDAATPQPRKNEMRVETLVETGSVRHESVVGAPPLAALIEQAQAAKDAFNAYDGPDHTEEQQTLEGRWEDLEARIASTPCKTVADALGLIQYAQKEITEPYSDDSTGMTIRRRAFDEAARFLRSETHHISFEDWSDLEPAIANVLYALDLVWDQVDGMIGSYARLRTFDDGAGHYYPITRREAECATYSIAQAMRHAKELHELYHR